MARHNVRGLANGQKWTRWYGILKDCILHQKSLFDSNLDQFNPLLNNPWTRTEQLDKVTKPTNTNRCIRLSYIIDIVSPLHISATLVVISKEMHFTTRIFHNLVFYICALVHTLLQSLDVRSLTSASK